MKDLIEKLIQVEDLAREAYRAAARAFASDREVVRFMEHQIEDEEEHARVLRLGLAAIDALPPEARPAPFGVAGATLALPIADLRAIQQGLSGPDRLSRTELAALVGHAENSEWNDLFLHVMRGLQAFGREFEAAAAEMQGHRVSVDEFVRRTEPMAHSPGRRDQPPLWTTTVLVVGTEPRFARDIESVLQRDLRVVVASSGREGLDRLKTSHFDAVVVEADLPDMDGLEWFRRAIEADPSVRGRFAFHTALQDGDARLAAAGVPVLARASGPAEIRGVIQQILRQGHAVPGGDRDRRG